MSKEFRKIKPRKIKKAKPGWFAESCPSCGATWESRSGWTTKCPAKGCHIGGNM